MRIYARNKVIWVDFWKNGKRYRKSTKLKDTNENRKKVALELVPMIENANMGLNKNIAYYYKAMLEEKSISTATIARYNGIYDKYIKQYSDRTAESFSVGELRRWVGSQNVKAKTVRLNVSVFKQILQEAIYDDVLKDNPFDKIRLPKLDKYEPEPFTPDEVELLLQNSSGWFRNLIAVLFMTGMRIGEAIALEWKDIGDFITIDKSIRKGVLGKTKTSNKRLIPLFESLVPYIENQRLETALKSKKVFVGINDSTDLRYHWRRLLKKCNMSHRILYQTRHTFAINALDSGMFRVSDISKMLGHASTQMLFNKYAKFIKSEVSELPRNFNPTGTKCGTKVS